MIDLSTTTHHHAIEEMTDILTSRTQNDDRSFFRIEAAYFLIKMAASMWATIHTTFMGVIPVSGYMLGLATSGYGKGLSVNIVEQELMKRFRTRFMGETFPLIADQNAWIIANDRAARHGTDPQTEKDKVDKEFRSKGPYVFAFDKASEPAMKQLREKVLMAGAGALNLQIDEIGSNLSESMEALTLCLELFDQGLVKPKLTKNSTDNQRGEDLDGRSPTNLLMFGTPSKLFDGAKTEDLIYELLETGYARRCFFAYGEKPPYTPNRKVDPVELYKKLANPQTSAAVSQWAGYFEQLADPARFLWKMEMQEPVCVQLLAYRLWCAERSAEMKEFQTIHKAEMEHRYFKALKLAGAFAFVDGSNEIEMEHLMPAILLTEESGQSFNRILTREKPHVRLAKYIAEVGAKVTEHELGQALPFYKGSAATRQDMLRLATSYGYRNNIIIKKSFEDGVEFFLGERLAETDRGRLIVSYSEHFAYNYVAEEAPFEQLDQLVQAPGLHWSNHHFKEGHRTKEKAIPGFNMLVFDVDGGIRLETVHDLLREVAFMTYTTKRHTEENHRFRIILPTSHVLKLDDEDYKLLYNQVLEWLPFASTNPDSDLDTSANQRSKKYLTHDGGLLHLNSDAPLFDILPFIPKTKRNEDYREEFKKVENLDNMERWFAQRMVDGSRNNHMVRFALALLDSGLDFKQTHDAVHAFNEKLSNKLDKGEIDNTIMVTVARRLKRIEQQAA